MVLSSNQHYHQNQQPPGKARRLTPLGRSLLAIVEALVTWSGDHVGDVQHARRHYDQAHHRTTRQPWSAGEP